MCSGLLPSTSQSNTPQQIIYRLILGKVQYEWNTDSPARDEPDHGVIKHKDPPTTYLNTYRIHIIDIRSWLAQQIHKNIDTLIHRYIDISIDKYIHRYIHTHIHVCNYLCIYVSMCPCIYVSVYLWIYVSMYRCIYVCMHVWMHACMYVCMSGYTDT